MASPNLWIVGPGSRGAEPGISASSRSRTLIAAFAERHVALTADLARTLAVLETTSVPAQTPFWGAGFRLAGASVGQASQVGRTSFWRAAVPCFLTSVAEPVLRQAMVRVGGVGLQGAADLGTPPKADDWQKLFNTEVVRLLATEEAMGQGFWIEAAMRLYGAALRDTETRAGRIAHRLGIRPVPPEPDPVLCRLVFEADPVFPNDFKIERRHQRTRNKSQRKRAGVRPKEGGVSGIRTSTMVDDLPDALMSELVLPPELVMDRLLHDGMMVRHRPPYRQPKRDLLVIGMADRRIATDAAAIVKAAWADAALRLQMLLVQMGLQMSDLIWSECSPIGTHASVLRVEDADLPAGLDPLLLEGRQRAARLFQTSLMPGFVDTLAGAENDAVQQTDTLVDLVTVLARTGLNRLQTRHRLGHGHIGQRPEFRHRPTDYARRIAIVMLGPDRQLMAQAEDDWSGVRTRLNARLRRVMEDDTRIIGVVAPEKLAPGASFLVMGNLVPAGRQEIEFDPDATERVALDKVLGGLSATLIRAVLEAVDAR